jgi:Immunity protein 50
MAEGGSYPGVDILGASRLTDLYGHFTPFHDAAIESVSIERLGPTVTIRFISCDAAYDGDMLTDSDRRADVVMRWHEVADLCLQGIDRRNWISGLDFFREGESIRTEIELMDGIRGQITARRIEVLDVQPSYDVKPDR